MVYVEDLLAISEDPKATMGYFIIYDLKEAVSPQDRYLGANFGKWQFLDGSNCRWMNGRDYITNAINLAKKLMEQKGKVFMYGKLAKIPKRK